MGESETTIIRQGNVKNVGQSGGIRAVGSGRDVTGAKEDHTAAANSLRGGQPAMAEEVEVVGGDHTTTVLIHLGAFWRGVARDQRAVEDNVAPEVA
jgi:hypothetical protein